MDFSAKDIAVFAPAFFKSVTTNISGYCSKSNIEFNAIEDEAINTCYDLHGDIHKDALLYEFTPMELVTMHFGKDVEADTTVAVNDISDYMAAFCHEFIEVLERRKRNLAASESEKQLVLLLCARPEGLLMYAARNKRIAMSARFLLMQKEEFRHRTTDSIETAATPAPASNQAGVPNKDQKQH